MVRRLSPMALWRVFCAVTGLVAAPLGVAGIFYAFTPAMRLEPNPGFEASLAVIALLVGVRFLWWAFAPTRLQLRKKKPR